MNILITGANGFVGRALMERLIKQGHHITALVRSKAKIKKKNGVKWIEGDLLHPDTLPELQNIDKAFYLVHGLKGDDRHFEYDESLAAVNFINWIRPSGAGIIYLGGLGPDRERLSPHLRSRHLTGAILGASGIPTIEFRASIILGEGSLSFEMIKALSERFPIRPIFPLLDQPCQPLALDDLFLYLEGALELSVDGHKIIEIGGPEVLPYGELLDLYSKLSGIKRIKVKIPEIDSRVLMLLLDYAVPELSQMGRKLTASLEHPTIVTNDAAKKFFPEINPMPLKEAMLRAIKESKSHYAPIWEKDFLKGLLSDKMLTKSLPPQLLKKLERALTVKNLLTRK